jgi:hypothetical protein
MTETANTKEFAIFKTAAATLDAHTSAINNLLDTFGAITAMERAVIAGLSINAIKNALVLNLIHCGPEPGQKFTETQALQILALAATATSAIAKNLTAGSVTTVHVAGDNATTPDFDFRAMLDKEGPKP